jgi:hypothetical protein
MNTIELQLTPGTLQRAQQIAAARQLSVEALIEEMLDSLGTAPSSTDTLLGLFSDEPELMDEVVADAMKTRENHSLRTKHG